MKKYPRHDKNIVALKRIEGQVRGIQRMIGEGKYCIDIVTQIHAVVNALCRVSENIFEKHIEHCVVDALKGKSAAQKRQKIDEIMQVIRMLHKVA